MTTTQNLLVELLVEELPPKALKKLGESFAAMLNDSLKTQGLVNDNSIVTPYASPRRLAAHITQVASKAVDKPVSQKLMPVAVGLDSSGQATPALLKKLMALGADASVVSQLRRENDGKTEALFLDVVTQGVALADGLTRALSDAIFNLPIPKLMTYQLADGWTTTHFARPIHGLVVLHGESLVEIKLEQRGLEAGRQTTGHRFDANIPSVVIKDADSYESQIEREGAVIPSFEKRRAEIARQLAAAAAKEGLKPIDDEALLDEVTALVERPNVLVGKFEKEFLEVPQECLILTMKANQKYFPLLDSKGKLTNKFLIVSNIRPTDASLVIGGNERVVRPRLADAKFFFDQDRKKTLASRVEGLRKVVYHNKLGTQGERVERVWAIAQAIGLQLGGDKLAVQAGEAAMLAKADLLTDMVGEFPELQGIMGRYYAQHDGLSDDIAFAIEDHYKPRFAGDELPRNQVGLCVALADKLETLAGMFGIGQTPTGDKDPFALRRHALGVVRIMVEKDLPFSLYQLFSEAFKAIPNVSDVSPEACSFVMERAKSYFAEQGISPKAIDAVMAPMGFASPLSILVPIVHEANRFIALPEGRVLAEANKRITNILKKSGFEVPFGMSPRVLKIVPDPSKFQQDEERTLFSALLTAGELSLKLREEKRFAEALSALIPLSTPVKEFFDKVLVNADQDDLRDNRITLLQHARAYMNQVADLSLMAS